MNQSQQNNTTMKKLCLSAVILSQIGSIIHALSFCPAPKISTHDNAYPYHTNINTQSSPLELSMSIGTKVVGGDRGQNQISPITKSTLPRHRPRRRRRKRQHALKPGPYHDLSVAELTVKTISLLKNTKVGQMTAGQAHECGKLIISWSKRAQNNKYKNKYNSYNVNYGYDSEKTMDLSLSGKMAERLLRRLVKEKSVGNELAKPSANLYNSVMNAWTKCGDRRGSQKSLDVLKLMESSMNMVDMNHRHYISKANSDAQTNHHLPEAEQKLPTTSRRKKKQPMLVAKCYLTAIDGCCKDKTKKSADIASYILLEQMRGLQNNGGRATRHFNAVLNAYASLYDHQSVLSLFQTMKELYQNGEVNVKPNQISYNIVIKSLSGGRTLGSVRKAERILQEMEDAFYNGDKDMTPDKISYSSTLAAWARFCSKQAVEKAEQYLARMEAMYEKGNRKVKPDTVTYNTVLNIIANGKNSDAGGRTLKILNNMEKLHELGDTGTKPNIVSYNAVIKAFSKNALNDGARRALMMLKKLENDPNLYPDTISYNSVLNAFAKAKDPISAQALLDRMERLYTDGYDIKPDTYSYNTVISAWAFSDHERAAEIAERIFDRMETSQIRLDTTTFNTLLSAWGRQKDPNAAERATDILHHMFAVKKSGQYDVRPSAQSFGIVLNAWAKSSEPRKAYRAKRLLMEMKERSTSNGKHLKPNSFIYSSILNACAFTSGDFQVKGEALTIAIETFRDCTNRNDVVHGSFIKACNKLMDHDDIRLIPMIETSFAQCVKDGQVSDFVLLELHSCLPDQVYQDLLGHPKYDILSVKDVPKSWSRNVTTR